MESTARHRRRWLRLRARVAGRGPASVRVGVGLLALAMPYSALAQTPPPLPDFSIGWHWVDFGPESGLPDGAVREIIEVDSVVWVRTDEGVAYFDGFFWQPAAFPGGPSAGAPTSLSPDGAGKVLLVQGGRIYRGGGQGFRRVLIPGPTPGLRPFRAVPDGEGGILFSATRNDLPTPRLWRIVGERLTEALPDPLSGLDHIWFTRSGRAWADDAFGLKVRDGSSWTPVPPITDPGEVLWVAEDSSRTGVAFRGGTRFERGLLTWRDGAPPVPVSSEGTNLAWSGNVGPHGRLLVLYETGDLRTSDGGAWRDVDLPPGRKAGLRSVMIATNGDLWFGTRQGLRLYRSSRTRWSVVRRPFPDPGNRVNSLLVDRDSVLWIGTNAGVTRHEFGVRNERFQDVLGEALTPVTGLAQGADGSIWVTSGSGFQGAFRYRRGTWSRYGPEQGADVGYVHRAFADREGGIWLASLGHRLRSSRSDGTGAVPDGGFYRFADGVLTNVTADLGLPATRAYSFAEAPDGTIWMGQLDGLIRLRQGQAEMVDVSGLIPRGSAPKIWDLAVDPHGHPWFALNPESALGLAYLDDQSRPHAVQPPGDESTRQVWSLLFDEGGALWIGTEGGVLRFKDGIWAHFDESEGMPTATVWPIALGPDALLIGTKGGGLLAMDRGEASNPPPRVRLEPTLVEDGVAYVRWTAASYWGEVPSTHIETRYRADGGNWSAWSAQRALTLAGLHGGMHDVEIQAKGLYGQVSGTGTATSFRIPLPLFLRPVFLGPVGVLLLALLAVVAQAQLRRRRDRTALAESERRLRTLVESAPEAIGILDAERGRFIDANDNALTLFGLSRTEMFGVNPFTLTTLSTPDGRDPDEVARELIGRALTGVTVAAEWVAVNSDGEEIPCELRIARLPSTTRTLLRVSLVDIRDRRASEARRAELEEQLRQATKLEAVGKLTGGVAHDFNNLLTVIKGNLELLVEEEGSLDAECSDLVEGALAAADRSAQLTQKLLAFSRRQTLRPRSLDLGSLLDGLQDLLRRSLGETVEVTVAVQPDAWRVTADPVQVENALINLAVNARDAMPAGGTLHIDARNRSITEDDAPDVLGLVPGDYVVVSVADTGSGMQPEVAQRAFDPFFTTKDVGRGSGLGLSMVYGFMTQSGGTVDLESTPGEGTAVHLYFPRSGDDALQHTEVRPAPEILPLGSGERVLVVEDDGGVRRLMTDLLSRMGYSVSVAPDGHTAIELLRGELPVDALITDVILPGGVSGVDVGREATALRPGLPVLYMSGYTDGKILDEARLDPAFDLLRKPFARDELARRLRALLDRDA